MHGLHTNCVHQHMGLCLSRHSQAAGGLERSSTQHGAVWHCRSTHQASKASTSTTPCSQQSNLQNNTNMVSTKSTKHSCTIHLLVKVCARRCIWMFDRVPHRIIPQIRIAGFKQGLTAQRMLARQGCNSSNLQQPVLNRSVDLRVLSGRTCLSSHDSECMLSNSICRVLAAMLCRHGCP